MSHSILLVVEKPDTKNLSVETWWSDFLNKVSNLKTKTNTDFQALSQNVFLILVERRVDILSDLISSLHGHAD